MNIKTLVDDQRALFNSNQTKDIGFRIKQLKKLKKVLETNEELLYKAIYNDFKKSEFDTFASELFLIYSEINETIKKVSKWAKKKRAKTNLANLPAKSYVIPEPLGVSLVIGPWNYPYQLSFAPAASAIAAGNTVILKPSELTLHSSNAMAQIINDNFDSDFFTVVEGGVTETTELLKQKFDKIFFTGSTNVGKVVYEAAAKNLTPVTLELGGKSPAFITKNCDLKNSAKRLVWSKFLNSGQTCIAPDYLLIENSVHDIFLEMLKEYIEKYNYSFDENNYIQIINDKNFTRLIELIDEDKIYYGGEHDRGQRYIQPTILSDINFDDKIMREEIFGPILPVISYDNLDSVISEVKKRPKPLSCYIFTNDSVIKEKILKEISFGGGAINDAVMHVSNHYLPFGGVGESGTGSYHGKAGFKTFSHYKSILEKPFIFEPLLKYPPYSKTKLAWIKRLLSL